MTVDEVAAAIVRRIGQGEHAVGSQLPTCKALADELGTNKNVVSRAYRKLAADGILDTSVGRGTFVTSQPPEAVMRQAADRIGLILAEAARLARASGMEMEKLVGLARQTAAEAYGRTGRPVAFVECNMLDARTLGAELERVIETPVRPLSIAAFFREMARDPAAFALVVVSLVHVREVEDGLAGRGLAAACPIETLFTLPTAESLTGVARLPAGARVAILCRNEGALSTLNGLVRAANPALALDASLIGDDRIDPAALRGYDLVLVTVAAARALRGHEGDLPQLVPVAFRIDQSDARRIAQRLEESRRGLADAA
jgi:DNA-binding transcriptional regulator YhcF (GntR family)